MKTPLSILLFLFCAIGLIAQKNDVELLKSEAGNEITYYVKSNVRDAMTVEMNVEGSGFTASAPMPVKTDLNAFEKKLLVKITLDPSGNSSYNVSYRTYKKTSAPAGPQFTGIKSNVSTSSGEDRPELKKGVVVFSKDGCGKCQYAKNYLKENNIAFKELNISQSDEDQQYMWKALMDGGFSGSSVQTPVIMVDGKIHYNMDLKAFLSGLKK